MKIRLDDLKRLIREALISDYDISTKPPGKFLGTPISEWNADQVMRAWKKHATNRYELMFYLQNGTTAEKIQASHELAICDRKMAFWEGHSAFSPSEARQIVDDLADEWKMPPIKVSSPVTSRVTVPQSKFPSPTGMAAPGTPGAKKVMHKTFGTGTIVKKLDGDKVMVIFDDKKFGGVAKTLPLSFLTLIDA
jgi:hypothetical protein